MWGGRRKWCTSAVREQVLYSLLVGLLVSSVISLPLLVWHYRRFGRVSAARMVLVGAAITYVAGVVAFTMFPLPELTPAWCEAFAATDPVLRPLTLVSDIRRDTAGMTWAETLTSTAVMQVVLNVVLFVPFGLVGRLLFEWSRAATVGAAAATSVAIELTQYTAVWGIFPCPYRIADVDDLLLNTSGAVVGVIVAGLGARVVPTRERLTAAREEPRPVTVWRRWIGMAVDTAAVGFVYVSVVVGVQIVLDVVGEPSTADGTRVRDLLGAVLAAVVVVVPALTGSGASFGQRAVWLQPVWADGARAGVVRRVARALVVPGVAVAAVVAGAAPLAVLWVFVVVASVPVTRGRRGLTGVLFRAEMADSRTLSDGPSSVREEPGVVVEAASPRSCP